MRTIRDTAPPRGRAERRTRGAVRSFLRTAALILLAAAGAGASEPGPEGKDAVVPVPEPGILYVRYGTPGGVKIRSVKRPAVPDDSPIPGPWRDRMNRLLLEELGLLAAEKSSATPGTGFITARTGPLKVEITPAGTVPARGPTSFVGVLPPGAGPDLADLTAEEAAVELETSGVLRTTRIHFAFDRSDILPESEPALRTIGEVLKNHPEWAIRVEGHADERGSDEYNFGLSRRRANAVRAYLVGNFGIAEGRLTSIGFGESLPLVDGTTEEAYAANRRVEFRLAE
ncbi:MAG: OmpA family protein [Candidatus Eisenbacteria bacterium]